MKGTAYYTVAGLLMVCSIIVFALSLVGNISLGCGYLTVFILSVIIAGLPPFRINLDDMKTFLGLSAVVVSALAWLLSIGVVAKKWLSFIPDYKTSLIAFMVLTVINWILLFAFSFTKKA